MRKKKIITLVMALLALVPAFAVLNEKDLAQTLSVLRYELEAAWKNAEARSERTRGRGQRQHAQLVEMMQRSNELSLMLYSQKQDYTFDMTYALNEVSRQYHEFAAQKLPFDDIITRLDIDIDRYDRLARTLKRLPPAFVRDISSLPDPSPASIMLYIIGGKTLGFCFIPSARVPPF